MTGAEDHRLLTPSPAAARATYPFKRPPANVCVHYDPPGSSEQLKVVYDRHFDRFFLREDDVSTLVLTACKSSKPRRSAARAQAERKKPAISGVQWGDVILPPRSVAKNIATPAISTEERLRGGTGASQTPCSIDQSDPQLSQTELRQGASTCALAGTAQATTKSASTPMTSEVAARSVIHSDHAPQTVTPANNDAENANPPYSTETPVVVSDSTQVQPDHSASRGTRSNPDSLQQVPSPYGSASRLRQKPPIIFEAAVVLLFAVRRFVRKQIQAKTAIAASDKSQQPMYVANEPTPSAPILIPSADASSHKCTSCDPQATVLPLDLTNVGIHDTKSVKPAASLRKIPQRKARIGNYAHHFAKAATQADESITAISGSCVRVENQDEKEIRWQGEVVHVKLTIPRAGECANRPPAPDSTQSSHRETGHAMTHIYSLRELARIRPHADGFRRVNQECTFAELTSSSSSSESEGEIAVVQAISSSDEDDGAEFQRGDRVLFQARHRWFKGTILRRIKKSWFYDIRAANGTLFEAIQAKRIRLFDGDDNVPVYRFDVGDRVLWQPVHASQESTREKKHTYRARVVCIRRPRTKSRQSTSQESAKRYDLELLTGRIVKKVAHDELRPLKTRSPFEHRDDTSRVPFTTRSVRPRTTTPQNTLPLHGL